jgi:hypothetical protein
LGTFQPFCTQRDFEVGEMIDKTRFGTIKTLYKCNVLRQSLRRQMVSKTRLGTMKRFHKYNALRQNLRRQRVGKTRSGTLQPLLQQYNPFSRLRGRKW